MSHSLDRNHPNLRELDALKLSYPGWQAHVKTVEEDHVRYPTLVAGAIERHDSIGHAWSAHKEKFVPRSLGRLSSEAEAQKFYEKTFCDGRSLDDEPCVAVPVRMIAWVDHPSC